MRTSLTLSTPRTIPLSPLALPKLLLLRYVGQLRQPYKEKRVVWAHSPAHAGSIALPLWQEIASSSARVTAKARRRGGGPTGTQPQWPSNLPQGPISQFPQPQKHHPGRPSLGGLWRVLRIPAIASCVLALVEPGATERPAYAVTLRQTRLNSSFCLCAFLSIKENNKISKKTN